MYLSGTLDVLCVAGDEAGVLGVVALVHLAWCRHFGVFVLCGFLERLHRNYINIYLSRGL